MTQVMSRSKGKWLAWGGSGVILALAWILFGFVSGKNVRVGRERKLWPPNPHASAVPWIEVNGKVYNHLRGEHPYHLEIGKTGMVYFFSDVSGEACFHLVATNGGAEVHIPYFGYYDGRGICSPAGSANHDWIESSELPGIVIKSRSSLGAENVLRTLVIDVQKRTLSESIEYTAKK